MTIEKRGNTYRIKQMKDGITYRITVDHKPTKREAEELIQEHIRNASGMPQEVHGMSFGNACLAYIDLKCNVLSPSTIKGYNKIIRQLPEWFKDRKLNQISGIDVQKMINDISPNLSAKSVYNVHGFVAGVLSTYRENLRLKTKLPQKGKFEPYTPTDDDVRAILKYEKGSRFEIPYRLAVFGMRRGELLALTREDLQGNWITINKALVEDPDGGYLIKPIPKTSESIRKVFIDSELADLIREKEGPIFDGDPNRLNKHLHDVQKKLGIHSFRLHDLRAYYVTMAHKIGIPDKFIMKNCGFSNSVVMDRVYKRAQEDAMMEFNEMYVVQLRDNLG